jgi:intracellular sulfur oxidation DsrE/DsrF family protein
MVRRAFSSLIPGIAALLFFPLPTLADTATVGVVIQVSDDNSRTWSQALNVVKNIQNVYGNDKVEVEVVVFGLGSAMLKLDSPLANRVDEKLAAGAKVFMCENTMRGQKLTKETRIPGSGT